ncbi:hypothetical protein SNE40_020242 [Patella caerulea]|uniref:Evolutionarily conserved signaling intermediate in Toll pathway, mitochondrial n=1 Tax=Patella caerulea TaxID=87958 RepID=A0AAN8G3S3_PATCE
MEKLRKLCTYVLQRRSHILNKNKLLIGYHTSSVRLWRDKVAIKIEEKLAVQHQGVFNEILAKKKADKTAFQTAIAYYIAKEKLYRRGHVEFIEAALHQMKEFGVERDLSAYKALLRVFPEGKMIPKSVWQVELFHYPKQQSCAIELMDQMEYHGVCPDREFGCILESIFGAEVHAFRKFRRMLYWLPKFKNASPYPIPYTLPIDPIELAMLALKRMVIDNQNKLTVWKTLEAEEEPLEDTFIVSAMSPEQKELIEEHPETKPLIVEGGYKTWLRNISQIYFVLRADPKPENFTKPPNDTRYEDEEDLFEFTTIFEEEKPKSVSNALSIHEQPDGTVLGMCITGTSSKNSIVTWIRYLQQTNPKLEKIPIVFQMRTPESGLQVIETDQEQNVGKFIS